MEVIKKYVVYLVEGSDKEGSFSVFRRYSSFLLLRKTMV